MFLAEWGEQTHNSPCFILYKPYSPSGKIKQFVWPYMVSGLSVAATKKIFSVVPNIFSFLSSFTSILIKVYSWGPTPSPVALSWSAHISLSLVLYIEGLFPNLITPFAFKVLNYHSINEL